MEILDEGVCISSTNFLVLVDGSAGGSFKATKGSRQEDHFSPFLFTMAVDALSRILLRVKK